MQICQMIELSGLNTEAVAELLAKHAVSVWDERFVKHLVLVTSAQTYAHIFSINLDSKFQSEMDLLALKYCKDALKPIVFEYLNEQILKNNELLESLNNVQ